MTTEQLSEHGVEPAALRRDEGLRDLLLIHLQGAAATRQVADTARGHVPALLGTYRDLGALRHDYPIVLFDGDVDTAMRSLAVMVDEMLREAGGPEGVDDELRRRIYRLEAGVKRDLSEGRGDSLAALWTNAARHEAGPLASAEPLDVDGRLLDCGPDTARAIIEHLWAMVHRDAARAERAVLDDLASRLSEVLEADRAGSKRATSAAALREAMAGEHAAGIDFEALAQVLRTGHQHTPLPASRRRRIRGALKTIDATRARHAGTGGNGATRPSLESTACSSAVQALGRARGVLERRVKLARAMRIARLELDNRYREPRHDAYFAAFDATQLTASECASMAPELVCVEAHTLDAQETLALLQTLASGLPVKVLLQLRELPSEATGLGSPGAPQTWTEHAASLAMSLGQVFVLQSALSHLPRLGAELAAGLRHPGPALFCVYTAATGADAALPDYLRAAAAMESRALPGFVYDPSRGDDWASRFNLTGNPQPEQTWARHEFAYEDADGREQCEEFAFTCIDFLALDPRLDAYFTVVPPQSWHPGMLPVAEYLALAPERAVRHVPFVHLLGAGDRLQRAVVKRELIAHARRCASHWRRLQELAGIDSAHTRRLLAEQQTRLQAEQPGAAEAPEPSPGGGPPVPTSLPGDPPPPDGDANAAASVDAAPDAPAEAAPTPGRDDAWIDTELCTSCDDCIHRNPQAFAYNEARQAYLKDAGAASYRELVEAAEECPVCIIHPGRPLDAREPGMDELLKRAESFL